MRYIVFAPVLLVALVVVTLAGCGTDSAEPKTSGSSTTKSTDGDHSDHDHGAHAGHGGSEKSDMDKMKAELAKLSPEDAKSAETQHICPVSDKMLGTMGAPKKVDVKGQSVWICCDACKDALLKKPDEFLAKLKKN